MNNDTDNFPNMPLYPAHPSFSKLALSKLVTDPRAAQLLALFNKSDERGKVTLLAIAGIHAARYPKEK